VSASVAGRTRPELERVVGWFVNNVIFRSRVDGRTTFRSFLTELAETVREALANQSYPIHEVLGAVAPDYLTNPCALDQVGFFMTRPENLDDRGFGLILLNSGDARMEFGTLEIRSVPLKAEGCTRDLTLYVQEFDGHIYATLNYDTDLFEPATIARIAADYEAVLRASVADPDHPIARLAVGRSGTLAGAADH
jgi:non-ribosomal peptide synthetase component F